jgi:ethanolamine utilization protein EutN
LEFGISFVIRHSSFVIRHAMLLARVEGNVVATRKHPSLEGWRLLICQPINATGGAEGVPQVAIDTHGAAQHQRVIISSDGMAARKAVGDEKSPVRMMIIGIVDERAND